MAKEPDLQIVQPPDDLPPPPSDFGQAGRDLWANIHGDYNIDDAGGIEMLKQACLAADRAARCREQINQDGEIIQTRAGGAKEHPLLRAELAAMAFIVRTLQRLGLNVEPLRPTVGRPPLGS